MKNRISELESYQPDYKRLEQQLAEAQKAYENLERTVEFMEREYLEQHGGSWGKCKYQAEVERLNHELKSCHTRNFTAGMERAAEIVDNLYSEGTYEGSITGLNAAQAIRAEIDK